MKIIKDLNLNKFQIDKSNSIRINSLLSNLQNGIPIGSVLKNNNNNWEELLIKDILNNEDLQLLKDSITERSCDIWEILNTGWIFKLENNFLKGELIFFSEKSSDKRIMDKINECK